MKIVKKWWADYKAAALKVEQDKEAVRQEQIKKMNTRCSEVVENLKTLGFRAVPDSCSSISSPRTKEPVYVTTYVVNANGEVYYLKITTGFGAVIERA